MSMFFHASAARARTDFGGVIPSWKGQGEEREREREREKEWRVPADVARMPRTWRTRDNASGIGGSGDRYYGSLGMPYRVLFS